MTSKCGNLVIQGISSLDWSTPHTNKSIQCVGQPFLNYEARLYNRKTFLHSSSFQSDAGNDSSTSVAAAASAVENDDPKKKKKIKRDLLKLNEMELSKLSHYEVLGDIPMHSNYEQIKRAYHKSCLSYHPDKTGRGEDDEVFLKVKAAFDTLSDVTKRKSYDSTVDFNESIPKGGESEAKFYKVYGPVFERNLRFAACNDPANMASNSDANAPTNNGGKKKKRNKSVSQSSNAEQKKDKAPPSFGDDNTPIEEVNAFYEFWIHFESWRDFTLKATEQTEHDVDAAECRDEKRWMAKEIDRKARAMKRDEMSRITRLVERAMAADPRLKREKEREKAEKARVAREKKEKAEREAKIKAEAKAKAQEEAAAKQAKEKEIKAKEKAEREKEKKALRKAKQQLRKSVMSSYQSNAAELNDMWDNIEDMNDDIELLCAELSLMDLTSLNTSFAKDNDVTQSLELVQDSVIQTREKLKQSTEEHNRKRQARRDAAAKKAAEQAKAKAMKPWTREELSALAKGVKKYPPGGGNRWDAIATFVNGLCHQGDEEEENRRNREECIEAYNTAATQGPTAIVAPAAAAAPASSSSPATKKAANATSSEEKKTEDVDNGWTEEQDKQLQEGLAKYPASMDKNERWAAIAKSVNGKGKKECVLRFKAIRNALKKK